jgi:hypothetical protein
VTRIAGTDLRDDCAVSYSTLQTLLANTPYATMVLLGAALIVLGLPGRAWAWPAALGFILYGAVGTLWIIVALCPHCPSYGQRSCPCGYGLIAARLRPQGDTEDFSRHFRLTIPAIVPLWFAPVIVAGYALITSFSVPMAVLAGVFALDAFVLLPWLSRGHGCKACPQRDRCPWWTRKADDVAVGG